MNKTEGIELYEKVFATIQEILNTFDPEGINTAGSSMMEYNPEAARITAYVIHNLKVLSEAPLLKEINRVWQDQFERPCPKAELIASAIVHDLGLNGSNKI